MRLLTLDRADIVQSKRKYTDEGYLIVPARIGRSGIQQYPAGKINMPNRRPDEIVSVYRPESVVFDEKSMASFSMKPVTNGHPPEMVDSKNVKSFSAGTSGEAVSRDGEFLSTTLVVHDEKTIKDIENGKCEVSSGYYAEYDFTPGLTPSGEHYDAKQTEILGNHIAIVVKGRAGQMCRVSDEDEQEIIIMSTITLDGIDIEVSGQAKQAIEKLQSSLTKATDKIKTMQETSDATEATLQAEVDDVKRKLTDAEAKIPTADQIDGLVAERSALIAKAKKIAPDFDPSGKSNDEIVKGAVLATTDSIDVSGQSAEYQAIYFKSRFDALDEKVSTTDGWDRVKINTTDASDIDTAEKKRQEFIKKTEAQYKGGK